MELVQVFPGSYFLKNFFKNFFKPAFAAFLGFTSKINSSKINSEKNKEKLFWLYHLFYENFMESID